VDALLITWFSEVDVLVKSRSFRSQSIR